MKKRLILLPLVGGLLLSGCTFTIFGKKITLFEKDEQSSGSGDGSGKQSTDGSGTTPATSDPGRVSTEGGTISGDITVGEGDFVLDFTDSSWKDDQITPYISATEDKGVLKDFTYQNMEFNDMGCYANKDNDGNRYLMMKNTGYGEGKNEYATGTPAFIGNKTPFTKPIKKVQLEINGASSSANTIYRVAISTKAPTLAITEKGITGQKGQKIYTTFDDAEAYYFSVSTNANSGKSYNGQILKVVVSF